MANLDLHGSASDAWEELSACFTSSPLRLSDFCFVLFEFRSVRSVRTIAGPGGVIGPLSKPNKVGEPPRTK